MHTHTVSFVESLTLSGPSGQIDSREGPSQRRSPTQPSSDASAASRGSSSGARPVAAGSANPRPAPAWWILHRLGSPQPFPMAGLPTSSAPMVGDRTWRRCRAAVQP